MCEGRRSGARGGGAGLGHRALSLSIMISVFLGGDFFSRFLGGFLGLLFSRSVRPKPQRGRYVRCWSAAWSTSTSLGTSELFFSAAS